MFNEKLIKSGATIWDCDQEKPIKDCMIVERNGITYAQYVAETNISREGIEMDVEVIREVEDFIIIEPALP